jgi:glycosyltransferase 2 family protein
VTSAAATAERVTRAPSDVLRLLVAVTALAATTLVAMLFGEEVADFLADLSQGLSALPEWLVTGTVAVQQVLALVLIGGGLVAALVQRRWVLVVSALVAVAGALALLVLLGPVIDVGATRVTDIDESRILIDPSETPSAAVLAAVTAIVTAGAPWISRRWRRAGWALVILFALVRSLGAPVSAETPAALLAGWVAGAATVVLIGAPSRRPTRSSIIDGLALGGVPLARLEPASVDARGSTPYFGETRDGVALFVKALGEDERSADVMFRLYRRIQPRDLGDEKSFSSLRRTVEHEALVACVARDVDVRTPRFVAFAQAEPNGYVLAYEAIAGRSLDRVEPDTLTDGVLDGCWQQLLLLRRHRIAHRDLRLANIFLDEDGHVWIIDFGFSELAASDLLLATDLAELLASSSTRVGPERAVAAARRALDTTGLATAMPRLQPSMLSGATRTALKASPGALDDLRARLALAPVAR